MKKRLRDLYLKIEEKSNFPPLSVYRSYTSGTDKFVTHSVHQPFKQKMLYVGICTPSHYLTSLVEGIIEKSIWQSYCKDKLWTCLLQLEVVILPQYWYDHQNLYDTWPTHSVNFLSHIQINFLRLHNNVRSSNCIVTDRTFRSNK